MGNIAAAQKKCSAIKTTFLWHLAAVALLMVLTIVSGYFAFNPSKSATITNTKASVLLELVNAGVFANNKRALDVAINKLSSDENVLAIWVEDGKTQKTSVFKGDKIPSSINASNLNLKVNDFGKHLLLRDKVSGFEGDKILNITTNKSSFNLNQFLFGIFIIVTFSLLYLLFVRVRTLMLSPLAIMSKSIDSFIGGDDNSFDDKQFKYDETRMLSSAVAKVIDYAKNYKHNLEHKEKCLDAVLGADKLGMWEWNIDTDKLYVDKKILNLLGYNSQAIQSYKKLLNDLIHPKDKIRVRQSMLELLNKKIENCTIEHRIKNSNGAWMWFMSNAKVVKWDEGNKPQKVMGFFHETSKRKQKEESQQLYAKVFNHMREGVIVFNERMEIEQVNPAFLELGQYSSVHQVKTFRNFVSHERHNEKFFIEVEEILRNCGFWRGQVWCHKSSGEIFPLQMSINSVQSEETGLHYVSVLHDITKTKQVEKELRYLANYDPLTSLPNRAFFMEQLSSRLDNARKNQGKLALVFCDLDNFKTINDSLGHAVGDILLQTAASRFRNCVKREDIVARLGGDEFVLLINDFEEVKEVIQIVDRILVEFGKIFKLDSHELVVGTSMGVCFYPDNGKDSQTLLKNADTAMYHAKQKGRNTYVFYKPDMNAKAVERREMESDLRKALIRNEMELYYQPKVNIKTGKITGVEALVRWNHPEKGVVGPDNFVPLAEECGLIVPIGQWVLSEACKQNRIWQQQGLDPILIAVNLSAYQFRTGDLAEFVASILWESDLEPQYLELELTESLIMENAEKSVLTLKVLKAMGVRIAIDDFGTGYSSLSYLKRFPIDSLKIDKSFVCDIINDADDAAIVNAIIAMGKSLKLTVLAEGVENKEQLDYLRKEQCDEMQGFYFSRPVPANQFTTLLQENAHIANSKLKHDNRDDFYDRIGE